MIKQHPCPVVSNFATYIPVCILSFKAHHYLRGANPKCQLCMVLSSTNSEFAFRMTEKPEILFFLCFFFCFFFVPPLFWYITNTCENFVYLSYLMKIYINLRSKDIYNTGNCSAMASTCHHVYDFIFLNSPETSQIHFFNTIINNQ